MPKEQSAADPAPLPSVMNPLWIISLFLGVAEVSAATAAALTSGWVQGTLTLFFVTFTTAVAVGFFWILLRRPYVLYAPRDFTEPTSITTFVKAHTLATPNQGVVVEELVAAAVQAAFNHSALVDAALSKSEDSLPAAQQESVTEKAVKAASEALNEHSTTSQHGPDGDHSNASDRIVQSAVDSSRRDGLEDLTFESVEDFQAYVTERRMTLPQLRAVAESLGVSIPGNYRKSALILRIAESIVGVDLEFTVDRIVSLPTSAEFPAVMGAAPVGEVAAWYEEFHEQLFGVNIRQYLGGQVLENREMLDSQPGNFVTSSNGVTLLVDRFFTIGNKVRAQGARVVNGVQTVIAIHQAHAADPSINDSAHVMVRVVSRS